jgi:stage II sporulation protein M
MKKKAKKEVKRIKFKAFLNENYSQSWAYIKESKNFIWAAVIIFFAATIIGFLYQPTFLVNWVIEQMKKALADTIGMSTSQLILYIFFNNIKAGFGGLIYGAGFGIITIILSILNGYAVGYVSSYSISSVGAGSLLNLLPHGIFELPAIFISFGMGIKFGSFIFYKEKMKNFSMRVFIFVVLPLLIIAAIIEGSLISVLK